MQIKKFVTFGLTCAFMSLLSAQAMAKEFDFSSLEKKIFETKLDNGLKLIILPDHDAPTVSVTTWVNVGSSDDPKGASGLAHMFEHMAFKGTKTFGTKDYEKEVVLMAKEDKIDKELREERAKGENADHKRIEQLEKQLNEAIAESYKLVVPNAFPSRLMSEGAVGLNAYTSTDQTVYHMSLPSNKLELWVAMESERFANPVMREMYKERLVITEERRMRSENSPSGRLMEEFLCTAFKAHPYGVPTIGHMSDILAYNRADAKKFFETYYSPSNMSIAIVGDVTPEEGLRLVKKYWERIPAHEVPSRIHTVEPKQNAERRVVLEEDTQPNMIIGWHIPEENSKDFAAIRALLSILAEGRTSRLYKRMVLKDQVAMSVGAFPGFPNEKYPCLAVAMAYPSQGKTNAECEKIIYEEIEKLKSEKVTADELSKYKTRFAVSFIRDLKDNLEMTQKLARYQQLYGDWRQAFRELDKVEAVTAEDIQRVAKEYFVKTNRTVACIETLAKDNSKGAK